MIVKQLKRFVASAMKRLADWVVHFLQHDLRFVSPLSRLCHNFAGVRSGGKLLYRRRE